MPSSRGAERSAERYLVDDDYRTRTTELAQEWDDTVTAAYRVEDDGGALNQSQVIGLANTLSEPRDVVVCAAGSMPGDLHKLWRTRDRKGYHVEYGYSCMGYEVAGGVGVRMASPDRDVFVMVGDGSYLMMATELVTAVQEGVKVILVLVQNHGFASIGSLSESLGRSVSAPPTATAIRPAGSRATSFPSTWPPMRPAWAPRSSK